MVPTAMDLGEALNLESDRIYDPVTQTTEALFSMKQLGWKVRQFHRRMMQCVACGAKPGCRAWPTLSDIPDDVRNPSTK